MKTENLPINHLTSGARILGKIYNLIRLMVLISD